MTMKKQLPVIPTSSLPPLYAAWMDQLLAGPIPSESDATCDDCAMCAKEGGPRNRSALLFNPETKCCAYIPALPNYLVGRVLGDSDPAAASGRATVEARVRAGVGVTPLGLAQPPNFEALYGLSAASLFGQSRTLRCPHYLADEGGRCGVWKHRASICATWFCKYVRGEVGLNFWRSIHQLLTAVESSLSRWCVLELGADTLRRLFPPLGAPSRGRNIDPRALDGLADSGLHRALWGDWVGREVEFYQECARRVSALAWREVIGIGGPEIQIYARLAQEAYGKLRSEESPASLKVGPFQVIEIGPDFSRVSSYNGFDPLDLPKPLMGVLHYFDGRPTAQALAAIAATEGVQLNAALVRKLTDFGILVPGESLQNRER